MISRAHRFHGFTSLRYVYKNGQAVRGPLFSVKHVLNQRRQTYRIAVVVSRRVNKSAVIRNRIRRRLYEIVRLLEDDISQPFDIVINVFSDLLAEMPSSKLSAQVKSQFKQAGILAKKPATKEEK